MADGALKLAPTVCACARCKNLVADKQLKRVLAAAASRTYRFHYASCRQDRSRGPVYWIQDCRARRTSSVVVDGSREGTELNTEGRNSLEQEYLYSAKTRRMRVCLNAYANVIKRCYIGGKFVPYHPV